MTKQSRIKELIRKCTAESWDPASVEFQQAFKRASGSYDAISEDAIVPLAFPDGLVLTGLTKRECGELVRLLCENGLRNDPRH